MGSSTNVAAEERVYESFEPTVDWTREPEADTLMVYLPGFKREQLKVQLTSARTLMLSGERSLEDGKKLSTFRKEFPMSFNYDSDGITAKFNNGILYVRHPKSKMIAPAEQHQSTQTTRPQKSPQGMVAQSPTEAPRSQKPRSPDAKPQQETTQPPSGASKLPQGKVAESAQPRKPPQDKDQSPSVAPKPPQAKVSESTLPPKPSQEKERPPTGAPKPPQSKVAESTQPPKPPQAREQPPSILAATEASKPDQKPSEEAGNKGSGIIQGRKSDSSRGENRKDNHSDLLVGKPSKYFNLLVVILILVGFAVYAWKSLTTPEVRKQSQN